MHNYSPDESVVTVEEAVNSLLFQEQSRVESKEKESKRERWFEMKIDTHSKVARLLLFVLITNV